MGKVQDVEDAEDEGEPEGEEGVDAADEDRVVELIGHAGRLAPPRVTARR